jgi:HD-GYP domain-containing protein (c-di-GMP phosphodiesterase class II)
MNLLRLSLDQLQVGRPLPWSVYNEQCQLLLHQGCLLQSQAQLEALLERGMYVDQADFDRHEQTRQHGERRSASALLWASLQTSVAHLLTHQLSGPDFALALGDAADDLHFAVKHQREEGLYESLSRDRPQDYAITHAMQAAFVGNLVAERMGWSESDRKRLTEASLTMNLGMTSLQAQLAMQLTPLSSGQRQAVADHGHLGRELLEQSGVTDTDWLHAVEHHHVTPNGGPLPANHAQFGELACLMHYTDVYLAKISARMSRPAMPSHLATRAFFVNGGGAANPHVSALIKELGVYPPGSCVQLANGETSIVVRRGDAAHQPEVCSLVDARGGSLPEPVRRNTAQDKFKVVHALPRSKLGQNIPSLSKLTQALAA